MRWHTHFHTTGTGHLYPGRFKSFPIEADDHLYTVLRYVERNPLRANLVERAEQWRWPSLHARQNESSTWRQLLSAWPVAAPTEWVNHVNEPQTEAELVAVRHSVSRGSPFGSEIWVRQTANALNLKHTQRPRGRPPKNQ